MAGPRPGRRVRGSTTGRPIMALLDLMGRRWILRVMWELRAEALGFRELQARCDGMSPSVLSQRLKELVDAGIVAGKDEGYRLSEEGRALLGLLAPLSAWAKRWAARKAPRGRRAPSRR